MLDLSFILLAFGFVLLNGFFVAAEFAIVKLRHTRVKSIQDLYGWRGKILSKVHSNLDVYLSACQLGITLASLGLGWIGEPTFARLVRPILQEFGIVSPAIVKAIAFGIAFLIISFLHIVIGELAPKSLAIRRPERVALWSAVPLYGFYWLMYPAIRLLNGSANILLSLMGLQAQHESENSYSSEELKLILNASHSHGQLLKEEMEILEHTLDFAELNAADVMRPVDELIALNLAEPIAVNLNKVVEHHYSRYPVYQAESTKLEGILHVKDLFAAIYQGQTIDNLATLMRPLLKIPRDLPALELLQQFRQGFSHFAIVTNDAGDQIGFVTLDNILGTLFGHIRDEFHKTKDDWIRAKDGAFIVKGNLSIYALEKALDIDIPIEGIDTISGLLLAKLERLPQLQERIPFENFDVVVLKMQGPRIVLVKVYPKLRTDDQVTYDA